MLSPCNVTWRLDWERERTKVMSHWACNWFGTELEIWSLLFLLHHKHHGPVANKVSNSPCSFEFWIHVLRLYQSIFMENGRSGKYQIPYLSGRRSTLKRSGRWSQYQCHKEYNWFGPFTKVNHFIYEVSGWEEMRRWMRLQRYLDMWLMVFKWNKISKWTNKINNLTLNSWIVNKTSPLPKSFS